MKISVGKSKKKEQKNCFFAKKNEEDISKKLGGAQYSALKIILVIYVYLTPKHVKL